MDFFSFPSLPPPIYVAAMVAFVAALGLVLTKRWHGRFSMDGWIGVQKNHSKPTPRIGGVSVFAGVVAAYLVASPDHAEIFKVILLAGLPAFVFGLAEDVTKRVGVMARLSATMASGVLAWSLTGISLTEVDVPIFDDLLGYAMVSVAFTAFAVGGVANAVNIIDGFNGLASGFVVIALNGLGLVSLTVGDVGLALACFSAAAAMLGFWLVNWPWGQLFLGDGGSYFGGFALAWASVMLIERNIEVSAFVPLLICVHPVTEVLFSIYRRRMTQVNPGHPDRLHLHTLIMRRVVKPLLVRAYPDEPKMVSRMRNSLTGLLLALGTIPAVLMALLAVHSTMLAVISCVVFALGYVSIYARLVRFRWCSPITFLFVRPKRLAVLR